MCRHRATAPRNAKRHSKKPEETQLHWKLALSPEKGGWGQGVSLSPANGRGSCLHFWGAITRKTIDRSIVPRLRRAQGRDLVESNLPARRDSCARTRFNGAQSKPGYAARKNKRNKNAITGDNGLIRGVKNREQMAGSTGAADFGWFVSTVSTVRFCRPPNLSSSPPSLPRYRHGAPLNRAPPIQTIPGRTGSLNARNRPRTPPANNSGALRPIIKLTRAFALVASDGIALIRSPTQYTAANAIADAAATRIALPLVPRSLPLSLSLSFSLWSKNYGWIRYFCLWISRFIKIDEKWLYNLRNKKKKRCRWLMDFHNRVCPSVVKL